MPTIDESSGANHLVASFREPAQARRAMVALLESLGVDAEAIRLLDDGTGVGTASGGGRPSAGSRSEADADAAVQRAGEQRFGKSIVRNYARGAVITGVVLGGVAALVVLALGLRPLAVALAAVGGAIAGFVLGGYWNVARKLPVNVDALDTFTMEAGDDGPVRVEVRVADGLVGDTEALFRDHDATEVQRAS